MLIANGGAPFLQDANVIGMAQYQIGVGPHVFHDNFRCRPIGTVDGLRVFGEKPGDLVQHLTHQHTMRWKVEEYGRNRDLRFFCNFGVPAGSYSAAGEHTDCAFQ